jgi:hypothetical protein
VTILVLFIILQVLDGVFTFIGVSYSALGMKYEANPLIAYLMIKVGTATGLMIVKVSVMLAGVFLYGSRGDKLSFTKVIMVVLTVLSVIYVVAIIGHVYALYILLDYDQLNF